MSPSPSLPLSSPFVHLFRSCATCHSSHLTSPRADYIWSLVCLPLTDSLCLKHPLLPFRFVGSALVADSFLHCISLEELSLSPPSFLLFLFPCSIIVAVYARYIHTLPRLLAVCWILVDPRLPAVFMRAYISSHLAPFHFLFVYPPRLYLSLAHITLSIVLGLLESFR